MYLVYILKSLKDNHLYIGRTNNIKRRLAEHNRGAVSATKYRMPFILLKTIGLNLKWNPVRLERVQKGYKREEIKREFGL